jgi:hypothetical protein
MGRAMDAHYKGHHIRFAAIPMSDKSAWTFVAVAIGVTGTQERVKLFNMERAEFANREEAIARGLLFVNKWIEENTPGALFDLVLRRVEELRGDP